MQDNSGLYFVVGAIVVVVAGIVFYNYNSGSLELPSSPKVVEHSTTIVNNPPAENTTIINPPAKEKPADLNIDIHTDHR